MKGRKIDKLAADEVFGCIPHGRGAYREKEEGGKVK
jgi:hypothetical protein